MPLTVVEQGGNRQRHINARPDQSHGVPGGVGGGNHVAVPSRQLNAQPLSKCLAIGVACHPPSLWFTDGTLPSRWSGGGNLYWPHAGLGPLLVRLLVTGGAGFIGSEFVRMTLREHPGDTVIVLDNLTYAGNRQNLAAVEGNPAFRFVQGDITDAAAVAPLAAEADVIVNFAAETHVDRSLQSPGQFIHTNVYGTWVLIEASRRAGHERFVQVSTDEVYGDVAEHHSAEGDALAPTSPYSASKAGAELQLWAYARSF